jgi:flagellar protein FliL
MTMTDEPTTEAPAAPADASGQGAADKGKKGKKAKKDKGGRSNLVPAVVLAIGIAAGGYFVGGSGAAATTDAEESAAEADELEAGDVVELEAVTVNLANGRFLRVGVAVLTSAEFESVDDEPRRFKPEHQSRLRDQLIAMFAGRDVATLTGAENIEATKAEMLDRVNVVLDGHAFEVYLTEFASQ